jgi:carbonic anhydrase
MDRRGFFRTAGGGVVAICSICASLTRATAEEAHWTYSGAQGPDHWGELASEAKVCTAGSEQSPIDLTGRGWDCQEFRAGLGMMGAKEAVHAATQRTSHS